MAALISAAILSIFGAKVKHPKLFLAFVGLVGTAAFVTQGASRCPTSRADATSPLLLVLAMLIGFSQISAVILSLHILSASIVEGQRPIADGSYQQSEPFSEESPFLTKERNNPYEEWKGSIAGQYHLFSTGSHTL